MHSLQNTFANNLKLIHIKPIVKNTDLKRTNTALKIGDYSKVLVKIVREKKITPVREEGQD